MKTNTKTSLLALFSAVMLFMPFAFADGEPGDVSTVTATPINTTSIGLSWDAATDVDGSPVAHYRVYYGTTSIQEAGTGDYDTILDTPNNNTSYVVTDLTPDTTYYFSITAMNSADLESVMYSYEGDATTTTEVVEEEADTTAPTVTDVVVVDKASVKVTFSEAVKLPNLFPEAAFSINEQVTSTNMLEVKGAELDTTDITGKTILLSTVEQIKDITYIVTAGIAITDLSDNPIISGNTDSGMFVGSDIEPVEEEVVVEETVEEIVEATEEVVEEEVIEEEIVVEEINEEEEEDTTPPENVTGLVLSFKITLETFTILMDWTASVDTAKDLVDQIVYMSTNRGTTYDSGKSLGKEVTHNEVASLEGGKEYTFKVTTKDEAGNESVGVVKSIRLPQTGLGLGFLLLGSAAAAGQALRRKKRK